MSKVLTSDNLHLSEPMPAPVAPPLATSEELDEAVLGFVADAVSGNTRRAYLSDLKHFENFGGTVPSSAETVANYLAACAGCYSIATIARRIAALSAIHAAKGFPNPIPSPLVKATWKGLRRQYGKPPRQAKPLLIENLLRIMPLLGESINDVRDGALLLVGFAGGFRRSELVALRCEDVEPVRQGLKVTIARAKTDQFGAGREVGIPFARGRFCPVKALETWLSKSNIVKGRIFRALNQHGQIIADQLSAEAVSAIVKKRAQQIGLDADGFSGHSLRAGLCTSAAAAGIGSLAIRQQTGHQSDTMVARYVRSGTLFSNNAAGLLL